MIEDTWMPSDEVVDLGSLCGTSLTSMSIALSVVIEYIYHTEEQASLNVVRLTVTQDITNSRTQS